MATSSSTQRTSTLRVLAGDQTFQIAELGAQPGAPSSGVKGCSDDGASEAMPNRAHGKGL